MIKVSLLAGTQDAEKVIAAAAKICYSSVGAENLMQGLDDEKTERFLDRLTELGHESPIEHASFTFAIEGVSRSLLAQITRHRIASFSVQSQRYVKIDGFAYVIPPEIEGNAQAKQIFIDTMNDLQNKYDELTLILFESHLAKMIAEGLDERKCRPAAEKMAIEDARYVLPNACETKMLVTMNARSLQNFFRLRCCNRAQWEIRDLAWQMLEICKKHSPTLFKRSGPSCVYGACSEGKMTCGHAAEVRERGNNCGR